MKQKRVFTEEQKTALQNARCKCSLIRYLARDKDGTLWGYLHKPKRAHNTWSCSGGGTTYVYLGSLTTDFPQITWEDEEPTSCEEILGENYTAREIFKQLKELLYKHEYRSQRDGVSFYQMDAESFCDELNELAAQYGVNPEEV